MSCAWTYGILFCVGRYSVHPKWFVRLVLVDYTRHFQDLHHPVTASLARETTTLIRHSRVSAQSATPVHLEPLGKSWLQKFRSRHSVVETGHTTRLDQQRIDGTEPELLKKWLAAYKAKMDEHQYPPAYFFNMDETGYAIGSSQSSPCLMTNDPIRNGLMTKKPTSGKATKSVCRETRMGHYS